MLFCKMIIFSSEKIFICSGLVLLTSLIKIARQENKKITVINIPKNLRDLARVSGVDILLPIDNIWL